MIDPFQSGHCFAEFHRRRPHTLRRSTIIALLIIVFFRPLAAQDKLLPVFQFNHLSNADGLPGNEIRSNVVRDRQGFIWFGTVNGLVRYDGYSCKVYRTFRGPHDALVLYFDSKGRLWVGTYGSGVSLYNPMKDRFVDFLPRQNDSLWLQTGHINSIVSVNATCTIDVEFTRSI